MNMWAWLFRKGIAGAISVDLIKKYMAIKSRHPDEPEDHIVARTWDLWLTLNENHILLENDAHKTARLEIVKERLSGKSQVDAILKEQQTLFSLYQDVLYIETEVLSQDGKVWHKAMKVFLYNAKKAGLDYEEEYESYRRTLAYLKP
jgi:hypothetical protein